MGPVPYDLIIGDVLFSQLLAPALIDLGVRHHVAAETLSRYGQPLTDAVVARLHASAPTGRVIHLHDPLVWSFGHLQPFPIDQALARAVHDPRPAHVLAGGHGPAAATRPFRWSASDSPCWAPPGGGGRSRPASTTWCAPP